MARLIAAAVFAALNAGAASAGTGTWQAQVLTQDGDDVVESGETATIRVSVDFSPRPGEIDQETGERVFCYGAVLADFLAQDAWSTGRVTWQLNWGQLYASLEPTLDPASQSLLDMGAGQLPTGGVTFDDPIWLIDIYWDPAGDYTPRRVGILADAKPIPDFFSPDDHFVVYESGSLGHAFWPLSPATFSFQIVPAPGAAALAVPIALVGARRRGRIAQR